MNFDWTPVFVLPNVQLHSAIECEIAALAPPHDPRVTVLKRAQPQFRRFLGRFADNFGEKFEPAVLLLRSDTPPSFFDIGAVASFRDLIAISVVAYNRALELRHPRGLRVLFGEAFAIYPWMLDKHYEDMIGSTPAILGTHELAKFKGQSSPALFRMSIDAHDLDQPLLAMLLARWRRHYGGEGWLADHDGRNDVCVGERPGGRQTPRLLGHLRPPFSQRHCRYLGAEFRARRGSR